MLRRLGFAALVVAALVAAPAVAAPAGLGPARGWELEPHLVLGAAAPWRGGYGAGVGVRAAITLGSFGVSPRVPDAIALSFGLDLVRTWGGSPYGVCVEHTPGPAGTSVCTRIDAPGNPGSYLVVPVVARWTLGLTPSIAVFAEPGIAMFFADGDGGATGAFALGGRLHISDTVDAVLRLGWPASTLGLAF